MLVNSLPTRVRRSSGVLPISSRPPPAVPARSKGAGTPITVAVRFVATSHFSACRLESPCTATVPYLIGCTGTSARYVTTSPAHYGSAKQTALPLNPYSATLRAPSVSHVCSAAAKRRGSLALYPPISLRIQTRARLRIALQEARDWPMQPNPALVRFLWMAVILLAFIGLAVTTRRAVVLLHRGTPTAPNNPAAALDAHFADHGPLTLAHILPAALFMLLGPLQFVRRIRSNHPRFHRWSGRIFLAASAVVGVTGLTMAFGKTVGGLDEKAAITLFGTFFLIALSRALWHAMHREFAQHREWMIRGYATGLAVAAIRPIMGAFFAAALLRGRTPEPSQFFGAAVWIGFTLELIAAELWINYTRPSAAAQLAVYAAK